MNTVLRLVPAVRYFKPAALALCVALSCQAQAQTSTVTGIVMNAQGQPVANAKVHVHGRQQYVYTNDKGEFQIQSPADARLHIAAKGYGDEFVTVNQQPLAVTLNSGGLERMTVSASGLHHYDLDMAHPVSVMSGEDLSRHTEATIGETLKTLPGVHSNYYGPVAASPVIRGLDGPRVKLLSNGMDTGDVSRVGPDHAISADAITTEQIEVLRGPATLLYGSGAIGGVVNIVDNRVPRQLRSPQTVVDARFNNVADEKTYALAHDGAIEQFAWHFDGFDRSSNNYEVPEFVNDEGEKLKVLENSALDNQALNLGASWVGSQGLFGVSIGHIDSQYGIPGHHAHDEEHEHEDEAADEHGAESGVYADLKQDRLSYTGELYNPFKGIETLSLSGAYTDYQHIEMDAGLPGTTFKNKSFENRFSAEHSDLLGWHGLVGVHYQHNDYKAFGVEAFTPDAKTSSLALFVLEERTFGEFSAQLGARLERSKHDAGALMLEHSHEEEHGEEEHEEDSGNSFAKFNALSVSAGLVWNFQSGYQWALSVSRSQRAPSAAEIYANGAHIATRSYELGLAYQLDDDGEIGFYNGKMQRETANNIDLGFRKVDGDFTFSYNFFYNQIDDYLYLANTGLGMDDLAAHDELDHEEHAGEAHDEHNHGDFDVYQYQQQDVRMYGAEFAMSYQLDSAQQLSLFADTVRAELKSGGDLPRIPPLKAGVEYQYQAQQWSTVLGATYYARQDKVSAYETETAGYTSFDASLNYYFDVQSGDVTAFLKGTNLSNKLGYVHSSFIKADTPLPGRAITLGITAKF
ncbi:TonB-dependent receptor domain-containing protein [Rheinheimera sp. 4Y26]|uniref:TonB-dependent receptor n=1 Tax=Rheinheimera sp. 4Y26 TaxID=2977811 RepID=UPI0021B1477F|nr:TonB-dependent receptor [Rheinheimera sp. 4Y26]MCT6699391.1 TonB-dependent receptor [Rheinheimera sp. 4Y26]